MTHATKMVLAAVAALTLVAALMARYEVAMTAPGRAVMLDRWTGRTWDSTYGRPWKPMVTATPEPAPQPRRPPLGDDFDFRPD